MPITTSTTATGGTGYINVRLAGGHAIHQVLISVGDVNTDADGCLPPGLPLQADGTPVDGAGQTAKYVTGPEAVEIADTDHFGNAILNGTLNQDAIEDNLGRDLTDNEVASLAENFQLV